jgi:hypothetical protein
VTVRFLPVAARVLSSTVAAGATLALAGGLLSVAAADPGPAPASDRPLAQRGSSAPGSLTGYGFDTCTAPPQAVMDAWWTASPYSAVGVYIGGSNRLCTDQPELDAGWVRAQQRRGWRVLSLYVGPQASCSGYADRMSSDLATAEQQGRAEAAKAVALAEGLGIRKGATLYYDLEDYDIAPDDCRRAALSFLSGWTDALHARHYDSGVYSNIAAAITSLDFAAQADAGAYTMPDDIWFAWANGRANTRTDDRVGSHEWDDHDRIHQYRTDVAQTFGGFTLTIDQNWVDVGLGSVAPRAKQLCTGVDVDLRRYPTLKAGARGPAVEAAQCLLRRSGFSKAKISGHYAASTAAAVRKAQRKLDQKVTGKVTRPTWVALLARGSRPVLKVGATGEQVRRLQRSLTAAGRRTRVDGVYSPRTEKAVVRYQRKAGLAATGVVTTEVWDAFLGR